MENKSDAVRREVLKSIIEMYGNKPKRIVVQHIKDKGVYKNFVDDEEVYSLAKKFAEYHKMPFGYYEQPKIQTSEEVEEEIIQDNIEKEDERDYFYESLLKEHDTLSRKLLALNKLIETYKR